MVAYQGILQSAVRLQNDALTELENLVEAHPLTTLKGVLAIAPDTPQMTARQPHEGTGAPPSGALALHTVEDLVDTHDRSV